MSIAKKGKRKIHHQGVEYFWWVEDDFEGHTGHSLIVTIASEDKSFLVKYYIDQRDNFHLTVLGRRFEAKQCTGGAWKRFKCPQFGETNIFTPKNVVQIIDWSLDSTKPRIEVDYMGNLVNA